MVTQSQSVSLKVLPSVERNLSCAQYVDIIRIRLEKHFIQLFFYGIHIRLGVALYSVWINSLWCPFYSALYTDGPVTKQVCPVFSLLYNHRTLFCMEIELTDAAGNVNWSMWLQASRFTSAIRRQCECVSVVQCSAFNSCTNYLFYWDEESVSAYSC